MVQHKSIYASEAERYDALVGREDFEGNLLRELQRITTLAGSEIVELGAGTGRVTRLIAPGAGNLHAFDAAIGMLEVARLHIQRMGLSNCSLAVGDNRRIPLADACKDILISGWSICYLADWGGEDWKTDLFASLSEMKRVLRPAGRIILLETQGTGFTTPHPPPHLDAYFSTLHELGFHSNWFRTDYCFKDNDEAADLAGFFFGKQMADLMITSGENKLPECTGSYWINACDLKVG